MFDEYRLHLDQSFLKGPNQTFASTVRAWRRAEAAIRGWPQITLLVLDRCRKWVHGWDRFPEALGLDCQLWCDRLTGSDLLEDAPFRPVRPVTVAAEIGRSAASPRLSFAGGAIPQRSHL